MRNSKYDEYTKEELQQLIDESNSIREVILKVGLSPNGMGGYTTFHNKVVEYNLEIEKLKKRSFHNKKRSFIQDKIPLDEILVVNSTFSRTHLKRRLLAEGLIQNVCSICGQLSEWNGKPLTLHLDHINGISNDNRLENLRIVCPHCHSQFETNGSKKLKKKYYCECGNEKHKLSKKCKKCSKQPKKFEISKEELERLIKVEKVPFTKIGKMFGVSDNAVRKRARKYGII